jgi:hypothetical protein
MQVPAVVQYAKQAAARAVAMGAPRAAAVLNELADSRSERVRLEAAKVSLQAAQIVGSGQNVSVNVGVELKAGWVINLAPENEAERQMIERQAKIVGGVAKVIDAEPVAGIGPDGLERDD